jgi:hypothetical protein
MRSSYIGRAVPRGGGNTLLSPADSSPVSSESHKLARLAGVLYLLTIPTTGAWYGISATVLGADTVTLASLEASRRMLEFAILLGAVGHVNHLVLVVVLRRLLRPFGKVAADLAFVFLVASVPLSFAAIARQLDMLALLDGGSAFTALSAEQSQTQLTLLIGSYESLFGTQAVFWGVWLLPLGWLLLRSGLVPRVLAVFVLLGGPFYVMSFVGPVVDSGFASSTAGQIFGFVTGVPELIGEFGTALWLTIRGAKSGRPVVPSGRLPE